jgi:hypothetical protein
VIGRSITTWIDEPETPPTDRFAIASPTGGGSGTLYFFFEPLLRDIMFNPSTPAEKAMAA